MQQEIIWDCNLAKKFVLLDETGFDRLLKALDYCNNLDIDFFLDDLTYCDDELWIWLSDKNDVLLNDIKRELSIRLSKSKTITDEEYKHKESRIGLNNVQKILKACGNRSVYSFYTLEEYFDGLRSYLRMEGKDSFISDLRDCFPNLFFADDIGASINSLNNDFNLIKDEIVDHLCALDMYKNQFDKMISDGCSNGEMSAAFKKDTKIDCSPQSGRDTTKQLRIQLYNTITKEKETVICELHTKFDTFNRDRLKQDRIYFALGRKGIEDGKIIIKHIGAHI